MILHLINSILELIIGELNMATRSTIGIRNSDNSIDMVYCHWDGYFEGVGLTLKENYNSEDKVRELLSLGSISSLGKDINDTVFYGRDRGESDIELETVISPIEYMDKCQEYNYLWNQNQWLCSRYEENKFNKF